MCDLQFNITPFTHHCFHTDGDLQEFVEYMLGGQILWYNTRRESKQMIDVLDKLVRVYAQVKYGKSKDFMTQESHLMLQKMSHQLIVGFTTDNAHINHAQCGDTVESLNNTIIPMFVTGQNQNVTAIFKTNQTIENLRTDVGALKDQIHRLTDLVNQLQPSSNNINLTQHQLQQHTATTLHSSSSDTETENKKSRNPAGKTKNNQYHKAQKGDVKEKLTRLLKI